MADSDFITLAHGYRILAVTPVGDGGVVLNDNFTLVDDFQGEFEAHRNTTYAVHGALSTNVAGRLVIRDGSGGFAAGIITVEKLISNSEITATTIQTTAIQATSITNDISIQRVTGSQDGVQIGSRPEINFIGDGNVEVHVEDNSDENRLDVIITGLGGSGGTGGVTKLDELDDVRITDVAVKDILVYNGNYWANSATPTIGSTTIDGGDRLIPALTVTQRWANTSTAYTGALVNILDAGSAPLSKTLSINVNGSPQMSLYRSGEFRLSSPDNVGNITLDPNSTRGKLVEVRRAGAIDAAFQILQDGTARFREMVNGLLYFEINPTGIGFFGVQPVARAAANADIKDALVAYGLLRSGSYSDLDLDNGTLTAGTVRTAHLWVDELSCRTLVAEQATVPLIYGSVINATKITDDISIQRVKVSKEGTQIAARPEINLIQGTNVTLTVTDDPTHNRCNVLVAAEIPGGVSVQKVNILQEGTLVASRANVNLIQGTNVSLTVADNAANDRADITISATGGITDPSTIDHQLLMGHGTYTHQQIDVILADLAPADAESLDGKALTVNGSLPMYTGYLSAGGPSYEAGYGAGSQVSYIVRTASFSLRTPNTSTAINLGDQGALRVKVNGVEQDSFDLAAVFNQDEKNGNQSYPATAAGTSTGGMIDIVSVGKYNNFRAYQKVVADVILSAAALSEGYNSIQLVHDLSSDQNSALFKVFWDTDSGANPSASTPTVQIDTLSSSKWLSGVRYLSTNDWISVGVVGSNLFNNVYAATPLSLSNFTGVPTFNVPPADAAVTGLSNPPAKGQTMTVTAKRLQLTTTGVCNWNTRLTCTPSDPYGNYTATTSASQNMLVSTYADGAAGSSDDRNEYFRDEYYRLPLTFDSSSTSATLTGQWNSQTALTSGNAQCYFDSTGTSHALVYPAINFSAAGVYLPAQTANYTGFTGNQQYLRGFIPTSNKTSVALTLGGVTAGIGVLGTGDINVEIKLPTQTGWLDCASPYSSAAGVVSDGLGCLSGSPVVGGGNTTLNLTFGGKTTGDSGGRMYLRITLRNSARTVKSVTTNW